MNWFRKKRHQVNDADQIVVQISPGAVFVNDERAAKQAARIQPGAEVVIVEDDLGDPAVQRAVLDEWTNSSRSARHPD